MANRQQVSRQQQIETYVKRIAIKQEKLPGVVITQPDTHSKALGGFLGEEGKNLSLKQKVKWVDRVLDVRRNMEFYQSLNEPQLQKLKDGAIFKVAMFTSKLRAASQPQKNIGIRLNQDGIGDKGAPSIILNPIDNLESQREQDKSRSRKQSASLSVVSHDTRPNSALRSSKEQNSNQELLGPLVWKQDRRNSTGSFSSHKKPSRSVPDKLKQDRFTATVQQAAQANKGYVDIDSERFAKVVLQHKTKQAIIRIQKRFKTEWANFRKLNPKGDDSNKNNPFNMPLPLLKSRLEKELAKSSKPALGQANSSLSRLSPQRTLFGTGISAVSITKAPGNEGGSRSLNPSSTAAILTKTTVIPLVLDMSVGSSTQTPNPKTEKTRKQSLGRAAERLKQSQLALFRNEVKAELSGQLLGVQRAEHSPQLLTQEVAFSREFYLPEHYQQLLTLLGRVSAAKSKHCATNEASKGPDRPGAAGNKDRFMQLLKAHLENDFPECPDGKPYLLGEGSLLHKQKACV